MAGDAFGRVVCAPLLALAVLAALTVTGCSKREDADSKKTSAPAPAPAPAAPAKDVAFKGQYTKFAEATWKNGQRVRVSNENANAILKVENGHVAYAQTYLNAGKAVHVKQYYKYRAEDAKPVKDGFDLALVFEKMDADTKNYNPDSINPKIEARRTPKGWELGLITTDKAGIQGGVEFH